jgi:type IV pilus assembly protein PilC
MPTYKFKAMDLAGATATGEVEAMSTQDVAEQLKQRGLVVVDVASKYNSRELNIDIFPRVKADELAVATRQLSTMVNAGMPILRALSVLEAQSSNKLLKSSLAAVRGDVEAGSNLSDAMAKHPKVFDELYVWSSPSRWASCSRWWPSSSRCSSTSSRSSPGTSQGSASSWSTSATR